MTMKLKIAQVIGLNTDQKAAQTVASTREENSFFAVMQITADDAFTKGRQILSSLEDFYFEFEGGAAEKLKATFDEAENKLLQDTEFDLGLAAILGKVLYIIGKNGIEVYLKRGEKLSSLLQAGSKGQLISGFLQDGDRLLFSTGSLTAFLGEDLEKSLKMPVEVFEEEVGGKIGASDLENQGLAGLEVEVLEENVEIAPLSGSETPETIDQTKPEGSRFKDILGKVLLLRRLGAYFPKSGRGRLVLAVILILIILSGAGYKFKASRDAKTQAEFNQLLAGARDDFNGAKGLTSLNPAEAKNKLDSSKYKVNKALMLKPKDNGAKDLKTQIDNESASILQQSQVSEFPEFLDLDLIKKNFRANQMSLSAGKLLVLDPAVKTLAVIDLNKKSNQILAGSEGLGEAVFASLNGGLAFVYSKDKGILRIDTTNQKLSSVAKKDPDLGDIKDLYSFAGNIYVLGAGQIWKYLPTPDGYSDKREYLTKNTKADFSGSLRMQIESSIYVLKTGGEILRFTRGEKDNFSLNGLPSPVKDPKSFFVSSDTDNLYLLDSGNSRLLILTKTGSYKGQITGAKFATATDLVVDEGGKKVYLLDGSKIYSVDLK